MKQSYRNAIEQGGDRIAAALGKAERLLAKTPDDPRGLAYKGSLLILIARTLQPPQREIYRNNALPLLREVLQGADDSKPWFTELVFVAGIPLLEQDPEEKFRTLARQRIQQAIGKADLPELSPFEIIGLLCAAAQISEQDGEQNSGQELLARARLIDPGLVEQTLRRRSQPV